MDPFGTTQLRRDSVSGGNREGTRRRVGRRAAVTLAVGALLCAGTWMLVGQGVHYSRLIGELRRADGWWLIVCLAGETLAYAAYSFLYRAIVGVDGGPRPSFRVALRITIASFNALAIATAVGPPAVDYWALRRMGEEPPAAAARVLALNTAQWALLGSAAALAAVALLAGARPTVDRTAALAWLTVVPACVLAAAWVASPRRRELRASRGGRVRRSFAAAIRGVVLVRAALRDPRARRRLLAGGSLFWLGEMLAAWAGLKAFGVTLGPAAVAFAFATGYASTALPLPGGGAGGVDAARTFALTLVGVPLGPALLGTFAARLFTFWLPLAAAAALAPSLRRLRVDLPAVARARARQRGDSAARPAGGSGHLPVTRS
jgi:uncharacterized membrane protein YbhN (UPF0104 family)